MGDYEVSATRYVSGRLALWCPVCGARENKACTPVNGIQFDSHNAYAAGTIFKPPVPILTGQFDSVPDRRDAPVRKPGYAPKEWKQ